MTEISMNIYRTKVIDIDSKQYTIRFAVNNDESEYAMFVSNDIDEKQTKYHFTKDTADDFNQITGEDFKESVINLIKSDVENGII